jgi:hypothetical protein
MFSALIAVPLSAANAHDSRNDRGRSIHDADEHFEIAAPPGYRLCGPPPGSFYRAAGIHIPLDKNFSCLNRGATIGAEVAFYPDIFTEDENDDWLNIEHNCIKNEGIATAAFFDSGNAVGSRPTRICMKIYKDGHYEKHVVVRRGDYDKKFELKFYNFYAKSSFQQRKEIDGLLAKVLKLFNVLP